MNLFFWRMDLDFSAARLVDWAGNGIITPPLSTGSVLKQSCVGGKGFRGFHTLLDMALLLDGLFFMEISSKDIL